MKSEKTVQTKRVQRKKMAEAQNFSCSAEKIEIEVIQLFSLIQTESGPEISKRKASFFFTLSKFSFPFAV